MNWANVLHAGNDVIIFGLTTNLSLYLSLLKTGGLTVDVFVTS